jgi:hypothetical protein
MTSSSPYNHPSEPVRHSYPLAINDAGLGTAVGLLLKTLPYIAVRLAILVGVSIATIIWFGGTFGGGAFLSEKVHPWLGWGWLVSGMGIYGWIWMTVVRYSLYLIKCGHIAVLTELITTDKISSGDKGMFQHGKDVVTEKFGQVNVLFALDALITGVVNAFNRTLDFVSSILPIPGLHALTNIVEGVLRAATTYIDETIFSYNLARGEENPWRGGRDGLIYYCQNCKEILKTAAFCVVIDYVLTAIAWFVMLAPAAVLTYILPFIGGWSFLVAILFAMNFRQAVLKPLFLIMIMTKFHVSVRGQAINLEWDERLAGISNKFGEIKDKIVGYTPGSSTSTASL